MFGVLERVLKPTAPPDRPEPPPGLTAFYWHFARQAKGLFAALFVAGFVVALLDSTIPVFVGRIVSLLSGSAPERLFGDYWHLLAGMALILLVVRPAAVTAQNLIANQAIAANVGNLIRWQSHWHVVRQSWAFFQNDFAGRIATRVMQTGPGMRESIVSSINAVWYILVYGTSATTLLLRVDPRLAIPMAVWFCAYCCLLRFFVPIMRDRSRAMSEVRSMLTGRVVDSYTNILTVKLFARAKDEDDFVREAIELHTATSRRQVRITTLFSVTLAVMNASLVVGTGSTAIWLWIAGRIEVGAVAMALPLAWQITSMAGWVATNVTAIFENVGVVQEGMHTIAVKRQMPDPPGAKELRVTRGAIRFDHVRFGYGTQRGVLHDLSLDIKPGERVGLVGHSGAGKSTLVNLLLHFYQPESGKIVIDGQDIATVTQESLRSQIAMVTQDTSLLHRSIRDNIRYGRPDASEADIVAPMSGFGAGAVRSDAQRLEACNRRQNGDRLPFYEPSGVAIG